MTIEDEDFKELIKLVEKVIQPRASHCSTSRCTILGFIQRTFGAVGSALCCFSDGLCFNDLNLSGDLFL